MIFQIAPKASRPRPLCLWGTEISVSTEGIFVSPLPAFLDRESAPERPGWRVTKVHFEEVPSGTPVHQCEVKEGRKRLLITGLSGTDLEKLAKSKTKDRVSSDVQSLLQEAFEADGVPSKDAERRAFMFGTRLTHEPGDEVASARTRLQKAQERSASSPAAQQQLNRELIASFSQLIGNLTMKPERIQEPTEKG